jgi:hypothetical protein
MDDGETRHEVFVELASGSRVLVGTDLPDVPSANAIARRWRELAETQPELFHETMPGSGCIVRGSAIVAIKAQKRRDAGKVQARFGGGRREGNWL